MISNKPDILIITNDYNTNLTQANRYKSFNESLNYNGLPCKILSINFPFITSPTESLKKNEGYLIDSYRTKSLNPIQKLLLLADDYNFNYPIKKILLALHIIFYKVDQWLISKKDLSFINTKASIVISGGASGIIKSAVYLADKNKAKLILDYRDPINFGYHLLETNRLIYKFKRFLTIQNEIRFLQKASHIITVSESLKSFFPSEFQEKITVIENGSNYEFDEIIDKINPIPQKFNIVYLGTIYNDQLLDETFFKGVKSFTEQHKITSENFKIYFLGSILNTQLPKLLQKYNLQAYAVITDRLNKEEISTYLENASMFFHLKYGNRSQIITSKNADYLMFKKPILLPISDQGDLAESIEKYKAGYVCNSIDETINALEVEYAKFIINEKITLNNGDFSFMSRSEISKKLVTVIENLKD